MSALGLFHVEQAPIDQATSGFAAAGHQGMAARLESHHSERGAKFAELGHRFSVEPAFPALAQMAKSRLPDPGRRLFLPFGEDFHGFVPSPDQAVTDRLRKLRP